MSTITKIVPTSPVVKIELTQDELQGLSDLLNCGVDYQALDFLSLKDLQVKVDQLAIPRKHYFTNVAEMKK